MTMEKKTEVLTLNDKTEGVTRRVLYQSPIDDDFERFLLLYKEDKRKARITYFHSRGDYIGGEYQNSRGFSFHNLILFEKPNGDFSIVLSKVKWGLSITTKMYKSETMQSMVSFKKSGNKFWLIARGKKEKKMLMPLTLSNLRTAFPYTEMQLIIIKELQNRFGWLRYVQENDVAHSVAFNTIVRNKLFSLESLMRHVYKAPYPVAKKLHLAVRLVSSIRTSGGKKALQLFMRYIRNIESLTEERAKSGLFWDTVRMGMVLDKQVNCSWGDARLKQEHDNWSMEITMVLMDSKSRDMRIDEIYSDFEEFSKYQLLKTTKEMVREGMVNKHCVASYISKVDSGKCGIFHINGHTLEVVKTLKEGGFFGLDMIQLKGFHNAPAPAELQQMVDDMLVSFNDEMRKRMENTKNGSESVALEGFNNGVEQGYMDMRLANELPF